MKKNNLLQPEKTPFLLRWGVIGAALVLVWPIGVVLLITKLIGIARETRALQIAAGTGIPFAAHKTTGEKQKYARIAAQMKKMRTTSLVITLLFLVLGGYGITQDWLKLFADGFTMPLLRDFAIHAAFLLLGLYMGKRCYTLQQEHIRVRKLSAAIGERPEVSVQELATAVALPPALVIELLLGMLGQYHFGSGAYLNKSGETLYCRRES